MPYLGRQVVTNLADFHVDNYAAGGGFTAGSTTQLTLTVAGIDDEEALSIFFDGVHQHHNTYTIASSVVTFDTAIPTGTANVEIHYGKQPVASALAANVIDSEHYVDGSIDTAHIAANQIDGTLTKDALIADYSDVTITAADLIMYGDATDSNNTKRDTVQGILDLAGGAWALISTGTASNSATLDFTGFNNSIYSSYKFIVENINPATDATDFWMRTSTNGGSSYDAGAADYDWAAVEAQTGQILTRGAASATRIILRSNSAIGNASTEGLSMEITLYVPGDGVLVTMVNFAYLTHTNGATLHSGHGGGFRDSATAVNAVRFLMDSGNMDTGTIRFLGQVK